MSLRLLKKIMSLALAFIIVLSLSCCGVGDEALINETTTESTSEATEATTPTLSKEELDALAQNMPEIVFVLSYQDDNENIFGYYVKNTGEVKIFDFREIAPDDIYDIPDVYYRLEEVTYDGIYFRKHGEPPGTKRISENNLKALSEDELIGYYKRLLLIEGDAEYVKWSIGLDGGWGYYKLYGIKNNYNGEKECLLLCGDGDDSEYRHSNPDSEELYIELMVTNSIFPDLRGQDWH